jgi:uncharacterized protein YcbK (DUF882 family)/LysM repeat protein
MAAAGPDLSAAAGTCYRNRPVAPRAPRRTSLGLALAALLSTAVAGAQQAPVSHTVQDGETLSQIAQRYHVSTASLAARNHLAAPYALRRGTTLRLPHTAVAPAVTAPAPSARTTPAPPAHAARAPTPPRVVPAPAPPPRVRSQTLASRSTVNRRGSRWGAPRTPGVVSLHRIYSDERVSANLRRPGRNVLGLMRRFLRSTSGATHAIDPRLLRTLAAVSDHFGGRTVEVISGFRPFRRGQYTPHSNHNSGRAIDYRVSGVPRRTLVDFCRTLPGVGCGFYPRSVFIHMDVRSDQAYWVDWSRPGERPRYGRDGQAPADRPARPASANANSAPAAVTAAPVTAAPAGADGEMDDVADDAPAIRTAQPSDPEHHDGDPPATESAPATDLPPPTTP